MSETDGTVKIDAVWLQSIVSHCRELMINLWGVSPLFVNELQCLLAQIGKNAEITKLYETISSKDLWLAATVPYAKPRVITTMFGFCTYEQRHDLDRQVYNVLAGQSLTVAYNSYMNFFTDKYVRWFAKFVAALEYFRSRSEMDDRQLEETTKSLLQVCRQYSKRTSHIWTHTIGHALVSTIDTNFLRKSGRISAKAIIEIMNQWADTLESIRTTLTASPTDFNENDDNSETTTSEADATKCKKRKHDDSNTTSGEATAHSLSNVDVESLSRRKRR